MRLSFLFFGNKPDEKWQLARQMGITNAIAKLAPELTGALPPWHYPSLEASKLMFESNGLTLYGLEGDQFDMNRIKFGLEGRDEDIELYKQMLVNMGRLGITLLCYNFMAGIGWYRTTTNVQQRAGALVSGFDNAVASRQPFTEFGEVGQEKIWENYRYFIDSVLPVAAQSGVKMALHPDDPPVSPLRGIGRIFIDAEGIRKALSLSSSPFHGITFCQGTFTTMGENVEALIKEFGNSQRIHFIHIRDVEGKADLFNETFHDNGPTNMVNMFRVYRSVGFTGAIRSDHVPTMAGEDNSQHGYAMKGNLFGVGYIKGIMEALDIEIR